MGRIAFLAFCLLLLIPLHTEADYYDGLRAFDAKNYASAFRLWREAADQGDAKSQFRLAKLYQQGLGTPQNFVKAHLYYNLAGAQGDANARRARDALAKEMSSEERAQARKLAANWVLKKTAAPSDAKASAKIAQPVDANERLEQLRKRIAKRQQERQLATQPAPKKQSAVATVATTSRQGQGDPKPYRIGLFPISSAGISTNTEAWLANFVKNYLQGNPALDLAYSANDPALNQPRIRKPEKLWIGGAVRKEPNLELVSAAARDRKLDGVVMIRLGAGCWNKCGAWVYVVDAQRQQIYHQEGTNNSLSSMTKQVLADFLAQRQVQSVHASAPGTASASGTYRIAVFPCDGKSVWRSVDDAVAPIMEVVHATINHDQSFVLAYSYYDRALRKPLIRKPDRLWTGGAVLREPKPSLVIAEGRAREVDVALMCWVDASGSAGVWSPSLPVSFYLFDIDKQQTYQAEGIKKDTQGLLRGLLSEFLAAREGQAVYAGATQPSPTQKVVSSISSQPVQSQPSKPKAAKRQKIEKPKAAKRHKTKKRKAKTPYKLIATKQPGQASNFKDGVERVVSQQGGTVVMLRPSDRILKGDLNLIVSVQNQTPSSFDFAPPNLSIHYAGQAYRAFTYDEASALKAKKKTGFAGFFLMGMAQGAAANAGLDTSSLTQMQSIYQDKNQGIDETISAMEKTYMQRTTVGPNGVFAGIVTFGPVRELGIGQPFEVWVTLPSAVHKFAFRVASP